MSRKLISKREADIVNCLFIWVIFGIFIAVGLSFLKIDLLNWLAVAIFVSIFPAAFIAVGILSKYGVPGRKCPKCGRDLTPIFNPDTSVNHWVCYKDGDFPD